MGGVLGEDVAVRWNDIGVVVLDGVSDLKPKLLVEVDGILVVGLHMQIHL